MDGQIPSSAELDAIIKSSENHKRPKGWVKKPSSICKACGNREDSSWHHMGSGHHEFDNDWSYEMLWMGMPGSTVPFAGTKTRQRRAIVRSPQQEAQVVENLERTRAWVREEKLKNDRLNAELDARFGPN